jgi:hypothetical protein
VSLQIDCASFDMRPPGASSEFVNLSISWRTGL